MLGTDSTTSYFLADGPHYLNHAQKLFQIGDNSSLGVIFWGLASLSSMSYRTLIAQLDDELAAKPPVSVADVMDRWIVRFSAAYQLALAAEQSAIICRQLAAKPPFDAGHVPPDPLARTAEEEEQFLSLRMQLTVGFCIGGYVGPERTPQAYFVHFEPHNQAQPIAKPIPMNTYGFWGAPNMIQRLLFGADDQTKQSILASGKWNGTPHELESVLMAHRLAHPVLPLREVVDFVHACIHSTIKALKFSHFSQICGGPIELAVISTDRKFRWVRHKVWDAAVVDGEIS